MPDDATMSAAPDAATMALLRALSEGDENGLAPDALFKTIASQSGDPTTLMLATLLMNGLGDDEDDGSSGDEIERLLAFADTDDFQTGSKVADDDGELDALREVNDTLAAALGACPKCWGGDDRCDACDGDGAPGATVPDQHLFTELILPAVRRINQTRSAGPNLAERSQNPATKEVHHG